MTAQRSPPANYVIGLVAVSAMALCGIILVAAESASVARSTTDDRGCLRDDGPSREPEAGGKGRRRRRRRRVPGLVSVPQRAATTAIDPGMARTRQTKSIGFRGRDAVELAAAFLPAIPAPKRPVEHYEGIGTVTVDGPVDRVADRRPGDGAGPSARPEERKTRKTDDLEGDDEMDGTPRPVQGDLLDFLNEEDDDDDAPEAAGVVRTFSRASKRRLGRAIAEARLVRQRSRTATAWPSFTATYPGEWRDGLPEPRGRLPAPAGAWRSGSSGPPAASSWACGSGSSSAEAHPTSTSSPRCRR